MMEHIKLFGGTNITLEKIIKIVPFVDLDGTNMRMEKYLLEQ